ncbi:MAG: hypothetical protein MI922_29160, partial [Bacteroidales bacterium]|nr:hypothetical protein [Bacteroidales bacterium]
NKEDSELIQGKKTDSGSWVQWEKILVGSGGHFHLKNKGTNMYFKPKENKNGSKMQMKPTTWTGAWTQYKFEVQLDGYNFVINKQTNKKIRIKSDKPNVNNKIELIDGKSKGDWTRWKIIAK